MGFSDNVKTEAKRKAHYKCVICQNPFLDVHHIIREADRGPNDLDNAAPLCAKCHDSFGDNPQKRKQIREMRDLWWELCSKKENENTEILQKLDEIKSKVEGNASDNTQMAGEIKKILIPYHQEIIDKISASSTASQAMVAAGATISSTKLGDRVHANVVCKRCGTQIGLLIGKNSCPTCGNPL